MDITATLRDDHDLLVHLVVAFREIINEPVAPAGIDLVKFRHAFSKRLLAHLTREDYFLYPKLLQDKDPQVTLTAQVFIDEMGGLLETYKDWSTRWPTERITEFWSQFVAETNDLLQALSLRMVRENEQLYPLVNGDIAHAA